MASRNPADYLPKTVKLKDWGDISIDIVYSRPLLLRTRIAMGFIKVGAWIMGAGFTATEGGGD